MKIEYKEWRISVCRQPWHKPWVALCIIQTGEKNVFIFNAEGMTQQEAFETAVKKIDNGYDNLVASK
jgi:hypothetical protein